MMSKAVALMIRQAMDRLITELGRGANSSGGGRGYPGTRPGTEWRALREHHGNA